MKKNNPYSIKSETNIDDLFRQLWKNKILILSLSILCMLLAFLHTLSKPQEFITKIIIKNPPPQLFETYNQFLTINPNFKFKINNNNNNSNLNLNNNNLDRHFSGEEFVFDFNLNLLSFDNLENFLEQSKEFDNFKEFLKKKKLSAKQYFQNGRFDNIKDKDQIILNKYYLIFPKELDGSLFLNNYIEYTKIKTQTEFKNKLKLVFLNNLLQYEQALEAAELINLDNPILLKSMPHQQSAILNEPEALFYNGTKILKQQIINKKKLILNLEADKFNYNPILDKASAPETMVKNQFLKTLAGLIFGLFLSLVIIFFRNILEKE